MHGTSGPIASRHPARAREPSRVARWIFRLALCFERRRERRALRSLGDDQLKDIGLSRADVERECARWPWDGPARDP